MGEEMTTPFQDWTMFFTFNEKDEGYTARDILIACCDSAIKDMDIKSTETLLLEKSEERWLITHVHWSSR